MEIQIKNLANDFKVQMAGLCVIFFCGVLHLALGASYIDKGNPYGTTTLSSLFASSKGVKGVGAFCIIGGLFMMAAPFLIYWNLNKIKTNPLMSKVSWHATVIAMLFNFTAAVLAAQIYTPIVKYLAKEGFSVSDLTGSYKNMVNFAVVDCIFAFILGLPASIILLFTANYHRTRVGVDNQSENPDNKDQSHHEEATGYFGRNSPPPHSVDLEKEPNNEDSLRKMDKEEPYREESERPENRNVEAERPPHQGLQIEIPQNQDVEGQRISPKFNNRGSFVVRSSPHFEVQSSSPARRSSDLKGLVGLPQAAAPKTFIS